MDRTILEILYIPTTLMEMAIATRRRFIMRIQGIILMGTVQDVTVIAITPRFIYIIIITVAQNAGVP